MATILSLKRRIQAARNVSKTTRAMQMISASKLKRAQDAAFAARPYVEKLQHMTQNIIGKIEKGDFVHRYMYQSDSEHKKLLIVLAPDKGLAGSLVTNIVRDFIKYEKENRDKALYITVGKKIEGKAAFISKSVIASFLFGTTTPTYDAIYPILRIIDEQYLNGKVSSVEVLYTHFNSFFSQTSKLTTLLPVTLEEEGSNSTSKTASYVFEPTPDKILPLLLRHNIEMRLYHYFLESFLSEQASRMIAMQNATNNANDIIEDLLLEYNKTRQAKITSELLDITGAGFAQAKN